ncbi:DUF4253 domain-containing protein [Costertonia aggregata]|uniref:DUF4253 domain-containing protein n=1 Tax=Costertonia aggregata TaxID=343403 RepID=A0A7H9AN10_9FLAO|nr:DUF4253 domain-containing protein [Costertonia aggregata]QLG44763.1 DUF4253 domain-containing protein [Costertonia aggregata]
MKWYTYPEKYTFIEPLKSVIMKYTFIFSLFLFHLFSLAQPPELTAFEKVMADEIEFDHDVLLLLRTRTSSEFIKVPADENHQIPAISIRMGHFDAPAVLKELKTKLLFSGYILFYADQGNDSTDGLHELRLLKTEDPLYPIQYAGTSTDSISNMEIYEKIETWTGYHGCTLVGAGKSWLMLKFVLPLEETEALAQDIIDFCPKILNFNGSKQYLATDLKDRPNLYLEW